MFKALFSAGYGEEDLHHFLVQLAAEGLLVRQLPRGHRLYHVWLRAAEPSKELRTWVRQTTYLPSSDCFKAVTLIR